ncbi:hypothetical protein ACSMXN_05640 [Jatrophihabitans sp. DSM 45814]
MRRLGSAVAAHERALNRLEQTRTELALAILEALARGVSLDDVARATGLTRDQIRGLGSAK